jgi:hypothetical protein
MSGMAAPPIELSGVAVVAAGSFNPAIFQPRWLLEKELITANAAEAAEKQLVVSPELTAFTADWLGLQVTLQQAIFSSVEEGRELDLRDLVKGVLGLLPETPVDAIGINSDSHFRVASDADWNEIGDRFLPKDLWEPIFEGGHWRRRPSGEAVGLRTVTVEVARKEPAGNVRVELAPSARLVPNGVYVGINSHFQISRPEQRGNAYEAAQIIDSEWEATRIFEREVTEHFLESA